nr:hypothetical protein [uncultured Methanomethylovorans sp.]
MEKECDGSDYSVVLDYDILCICGAGRSTGCTLHRKCLESS